MNSAFLSGVMLLLCILAFMFFVFRGKSPFLIAVICAAALGFFTEGGVLNALFTTIPESIAGTIIDTFWMFTVAGVLGEFYAVTGYGEKMGKAILKVIPKKFAPFIVLLISALFNIIGMPKRDFIMAAIGFPLMYAADMPLYLALVADYGITNVLSWALPGIAALPNLLPASIFGVDELMYAAPVGWTITIFGVAAIVLYMLFLIRQSEKKEIHYMDTDSGKGMYTMVGKVHHDEGGKEGQQNTLFAFMPIIIVVAGALILNMGMGLDSVPASVIAQTTAILFMIVTGRKFIQDGKSVTEHITDSALRMMPVIATVGMVAGFAAVASDTKAYSALLEAVFNLNISPYLLVVIIVSVISALTSDAVATIISLQSTDIAARLLATGANGGALACLTRISSCGFAQFPWSTNSLIPLQIYGFSYKTGYKYMFYMTVLVPVAMSLLGVALSNIFYAI